MKEILRPRIGNKYLIKDEKGNTAKATLSMKMKRVNGVDFMWSFENDKARDSFGGSVIGIYSVKD